MIVDRYDCSYIVIYIDVDCVVLVEDMGIERSDLVFGR